MTNPQTTPLPDPDNVLENADMHVQEMIYGHRFIPEQEPFMLVLEALAVCAGKPLGTVKPEDNSHESFHYDLPHRRKMRFLLFVERHLQKIAHDETTPPHDKWELWKNEANVQFGRNKDGHDHFAYLDSVFDRDINALFQAVRLLRSRELDVSHNRRWTSRFLAVTGPDMICPDMREQSNSSRSWAPDRRFFGRGGELIYLMLNRSSNASEVGELINKRLLNPDEPMNQIAAALSDPSDDKRSNPNIGYLPLKEHPAYDRLAEDWHGILSLNQLPDGHLFEPLFRITGLNLAVYLAERACDEIGAPRPEPIVADLTDGDDRQLRQSAKEHLNRHRQAANRAVQAFVENRVANDDGWQTAVTREDRTAAKTVINRLFSYENREPSLSTPKRQLDALIASATSRDKNNMHTNLLPLVKNIGLATSRSNIGTWFAIDDTMLFALVMANVSHTVELRDFVARLYERYSLVIGPEEARRAFVRLPVGAPSFEANLAALETRMTRLTLTRRLSDDCAFVTNPYWSDHD